MITFDCMKKIKEERPQIIEVKKYKGFTFEYSGYCFVKNKYGYTIARYMRCEEQNSEYWDDSPSIHPLNENDEWYLLNEKPIFSHSILFGRIKSKESSLLLEMQGDEFDSYRKEYNKMIKNTLISLKKGDYL